MYKVYQVMAGDTIDIIAGKVNTNPGEIIELNGLVSEVVPGQFIVVPSMENNLFDMYTVQSGDNMYEIARRYNMNYKELLEINGLDEDDYIYPNQQILIPKSGVDVYITEEGDTLGLVSEKWGISVSDIVNQNETIFLLPGQMIIKRG